MRSRKLQFLILLFVLLGFALRVKNLDSFSFWIDEGLTPLRSGYSIPEILSNQITIQEGTGKDTHPALHYLLIHFSRRWFGESDLAYRYPSVLAGVLLIPLIFQLSKAIDKQKAALLAALLTTINPLQIWYGQEARMYTLLVLLAAGASFALWRALTGHSTARYLAIYLVLGGLAAYTHYTALLLVAGQSIFWIWLLWQKGYRRLLTAAGLVAILIALPLIPFTVPRLFTGAEANYFYVPPWIMLQDVVHGFGLGMTVDLAQLNVKLLDIAAGLMLLSGLLHFQRGKAQSRLKQAFLLVYLLAAVLGLMLGSLIKPMYMGARHIMVGSSAFMLITARGTLSLGKLERRPIFRWLARGTMIVGIVGLIGGPLHSLNNLYHNPAYAKDDFRRLFHHVEMHAGENDLLLLNNAIHLPLYQHYQNRPDLDAIALPIYPYRVRPETERKLEGLGQKYDRIWFIADPPADGRDDEQMVRHWMAQNTVPISSFWAQGRNFEAKVTVHSTKPSTLDELPAGTISIKAQRGATAVLSGLLLDFEQPAALPTLWFELFWQNPIDGLQGQDLSFSLWNQNGKSWAQMSQPMTNNPDNESGRFARQVHYLDLPPGIPPGTYELRLSIENGGNPLTLATIALASTANWPVQPNWPFHSSDGLIFENGLELRGLSYIEDEVKPGHALPISIYWQAPQAPAGSQYQLEVVGPQGQVVHSQTETPVADWLASENWPTNTTLLEQTGIYFAPDAKPGRYRLRWSLLSGETAIPVRPVWRPWQTDNAILGHVDLQPWPMETQLPNIPTVLQAQFGTEIELHGYQIAGEFAPGNSLDVKLVWLCHQAPANNYRVFVHLVSAVDGNIVSQQDQIPVNWLRPTSGWRKGEVLIDDYTLAIPAELPFGTYYLYTGMYEPESKQRLPITHQGSLQTNQQLLLTSLEH